MNQELKDLCRLLTQSTPGGMTVGLVDIESGRVIGHSVADHSESIALMAKAAIRPLLDTNHEAMHLFRGALGLDSGAPVATTARSAVAVDGRLLIARTIQAGHKALFVALDETSAEDAWSELDGTAMLIETLLGTPTSQPA